MNTEEIWEIIPGYPNHKISNLGRIKGPKRAVPMKTPTSKGWPRVSLSVNGISKTYFVHYLVALVFLGPRPKNLEIDHINGMKSDNRSVNLRYVTRLENIRSARKLGLYNKALMNGSRNPASKLTIEQAIEIKNSVEQTARLAMRFSISPSAIRRIRSGTSWAHLD